MAALVVSLIGGSACTTESAVKLDDQQLLALEQFDYSDWAATLSAFVDDEGKVDYAALKADCHRLDRFVALLAVVGPRTRPDLFEDRAAQLAYYLNAYNALTLFNVALRYPDIESVYDEKIDFFGLTFFRLDGERTNLHDLEQSLIRPRFQEPRVHFALNCASAGCPQLPAEPFVPERLEAQLDAETDAFLHRPDNVQREEDAVVLSQIFEWYAEDFPPSPLAWIRDRAPDLGIPPGARVSYAPYDWTLNDQRR